MSGFRDLEKPNRTYSRRCHNPECDEMYCTYSKYSSFCGKCKPEFLGYKKCPEWLKRCYRRSVQYRCQECKKLEVEVGILTPHRIKRGNNGGLYTVFPLTDKRNNIKVVCRDCHKKLHGREFT